MFSRTGRRTGTRCAALAALIIGLGALDAAPASASFLGLLDTASKCSGSGCERPVAEISDKALGLASRLSDGGLVGVGALVLATGDSWGPRDALPFALGASPFHPPLRSGRFKTGAASPPSQGNDVRATVAVPEPSILVLFGLGLAIMARQARRSRRR